jgi:hypothetical protein
VAIEPRHQAIAHQLARIFGYQRPGGFHGGHVRFIRCEIERRS